MESAQPPAYQAAKAFDVDYIRTYALSCAEAGYNATNLPVQTLPSPGSLPFNAISQVIPAAGTILPLEQRLLYLAENSAVFGLARARLNDTLTRVLWNLDEGSPSKVSSYEFGYKHIHLGCSRATGSTVVIKISLDGPKAQNIVVGGCLDCEVAGRDDCSIKDSVIRPGGEVVQTEHESHARKKRRFGRAKQTDENASSPTAAIIPGHNEEPSSTLQGYQTASNPTNPGAERSKDIQQVTASEADGDDLPIDIGQSSVNTVIVEAERVVPSASDTIDDYSRKSRVHLVTDTARSTPASPFIEHVTWSSALPQSSPLPVQNPNSKDSHTELQLALYHLQRHDTCFQTLVRERDELESRIRQLEQAGEASERLERLKYKSELKTLRSRIKELETKVIDIDGMYRKEKNKYHDSVRRIESLAELMGVKKGDEWDIDDLLDMMLETEEIRSRSRRERGD